MPMLDDISTALDTLKLDFEAYKSGVNQMIADALAAASAAEQPALQALADKIAALDLEVKGTVTAPAV